MDFPTFLIFASVALVAALGLLTLAGWLWHVKALRSFATDFVSMNPLTALCLVVAAASVALTQLRRRRAACAAALTVVAAASAKLADVLFGTLPVDRFLFADRLAVDFGELPNRMAPTTATTLLLGGLAVALLHARWRHAQVLSQLFGTWISAMAVFAFISYGLDLHYLRKLDDSVPMALPTAFAIFLLGTGILTLSRDSAFLHILRADDGPAGTMCRYVLPLVVTIPVATGALRIWAQRNGHIDEQTGMAMQITSGVIVASTLLMVSALALHRSDRERRDRERELRASEQFSRLVASANPDCISLLDEDATVLFANEAMLRAHGLADMAELVGNSFGYRLDPADRVECDAALEAARRCGVGRFCLRHVDPDGGDQRWYDAIISKLPADHDWPFRYLAISRDISEKRQIEEQVRWKAMHDDLTGLPNRAQFQAHLDRHVQRIGEECFALLVLDIDNFKVVNDTLGHDAGDRLLQAVAERIARSVRHGDIVARLAGDEFAVIARNVRSGPAAVAVAEHILEALREPWVYQGRLDECRVSIGAALAPRHGRSGEELFKHADIALYDAKSRGKARVAVFRQSMKAAVERRSRQISLARDALARDLITPYYQPKVALSSGRVAGFEALLRWRHPSHGTQMPSTIQAAFEDLELASQITDRMVAQVIRDIRRWRDRDVPFGHVAINVTAADLRQDAFAERLLVLLDGHGLPHDCLQVEITETVFMGRGAEYVERALRRLHDAGIRVALDDFGTGYASLSHLKQFPVDIVKIDRSFLHDFALDPQNQAIINTVINLGHSLDIEIVAEGIETREQECHLLARGCTYGQGYLYGRAVPATRVPKLVADTGRAMLRAA